MNLVACEDVGHDRNMGTRFEAYVDESADWVIACDADVLCFEDLTPVIERAELEGRDFVGRISGRYRKAPRTLRMVDYCNLFRQNNLPELALHVPNVFFIRGALSRQLAESAICSHCRYVRIRKTRSGGRKLNCGICGCRLRGRRTLINLARYEETRRWGCKHPDGSRWKKAGV